MRSISDKMPRHSKIDESSSELAADGPVVDLYEKTAERVPERHLQSEKRRKGGSTEPLTIGELISIEVTELISAEASMDGMHPCLEGVDFDVVVTSHAEKLTPDTIKLTPDGAGWN